MTQLKYWNGSSWVTAVVGAQGSQGFQGAQGVQGTPGSSPYLYASDYGVSTSASNNTAALQAWLDAVHSTGRTGWIDAGTYAYTGTLKFYSNMLLRGAAPSGAVSGSILRYNGTGGRTTTSASAALGATQVAVNAGTLNAGSSSNPLIGTIETQYGNQSISYYVSGGILYLTAGSFIGAISSGAQVWNKAINANSTRNVTLYDLTFTFGDTSFGGVLLDFSGASISGGPGISAHIYIYGGNICGFYAGSNYARLLNFNNSYNVSINGVKFGNAYCAIEGCSSTSGVTTDINYNYVNGMTIKDCMFDTMAGMSIYNPGESCTIINPTAEPNSGVANFLVGNLANSLNDACSIVGGWIGDATSGSWITWQGGSLNSTGVLYGYQSKMLTLTGDTSAISITGGSISAGTYGAPASAIDLGNYSVGSFVLQAITWGSNVSPRVANTSGIISANYESTAGTHTTDSVIGTSFAISGSAPANLVSVDDAYQATASSIGTYFANNSTTTTFDSSVKLDSNSAGSIAVTTTGGGSAPSFGVGGYLGANWPTATAATGEYIPAVNGTHIPAIGGAPYTSLITMQTKNSAANLNPGSWRIRQIAAAIDALTITSAVVTGGNLITYNFTGCSSGLASTLTSSFASISPRIAGFAYSALNSTNAITSVSTISGGAGSFTIAGTGLTNGTYTALASTWTYVGTLFELQSVYSGYSLLAGLTTLKVSATVPLGTTHIRCVVYCQTALPTGQIYNASLFGVFQASTANWIAPGASVSPIFSATGIYGAGQKASGFGIGTAGNDLATVGQLPTLTSLNGLSLAGGTMTGSLDISGAGNGLKVAEGSNAKQGVATLSAGTVTVSNTSVTATSRIFLTVQSLGTVVVPQALAVTARTAGTSFTITSASITDTSVVAYEIFEVG